MDAGLLTIVAGRYRTFWSAAAILSRFLPQSAVPDLATGLVLGHLLAAALDWAPHPSPAQALRPGGKRRRYGAGGTQPPGFRPTRLVSS